MQFQTYINFNMPATSVQSISRSVGQKVHFLGWPAVDFEAHDDDHMLLMIVRDVGEDLLIPKNQIFREIRKPESSEREKGAKSGSPGKIRAPRVPGSPATLGHGRRRPWARRPWARVAGDPGSKVAGDPGAFWALRVAVSRPFFGLFRRFFLLYFS